MNIVTCFYCRQEVLEPTGDERDAVKQRIVETFGPGAVAFFYDDEAGWQHDVMYARVVCRLLHKGE